MAKLPEFFHFRILSGLTEIRIQDVSDRDFVEVVRCRDCKYYDNGWCHRAHNPAQYSKTTDDWFCADGEKREESWCVWRSDIDAAPTIIEAEEGEKNV